MTTCIRCTALGIAPRVLQFYDKLELQPWDVFANRPNAHYPRQTGTTTHGVLEVIAECFETKHDAIACSNRHIRGIIIDFLERLGDGRMLPLSVYGTSGMPHYGTGVLVYEDLGGPW